MRAALLLLSFALAACGDEPRGRHDRTRHEAEKELSKSPRDLVYAVDLEHVRALCWAAADATDADALQAAVATLARRLPFGPDASLSVLPDGTGIQVRTGPLTDPQAERMAGAIASLGRVELRIVADAKRLALPGLDLDAEARKLEDWRTANPDAPLAAFGRVPADQGGPDARIAWLPRRFPTGEVQPAPVLLPQSFEACFGSGDFERVYVTADAQGYPTLGFEFGPGARAAFADFTEENIDRLLGIAIEDEIVTAPTIAARLPWAGIVNANWEDRAEVEGLAAELRSEAGPLRRVR